ncbi:MAG TPA: tetratricopeptide repeat protein [Thermoanaerobaculia bacterium]|jgi:tetratricopeptide (TPR) repeat protein|nr:tetratricopeptide repeat protein [Thermoanaerobaculia bacterium]
MSDGAFPDRVTLLRNRWEADPSSRIFLQLAEEYRHQGRVKEALEVLDRGLKEHPGYLSALVAKGRCHLELGEPESARTVLERVVKQDATQMVANKLLVRAYLETNDPERARERLDLYSLLNDSDPEIEELRRRLRAMDQPPPGEKPGSTPPSDSSFPEAPPAAPPRRDAPPASPPGGDIFDLGIPSPRPAATVSPEEPFADLLAQAASPVATAAAASPAPAPVAEAAPEPEEEPEPAEVLFPGLASRDRRLRYLASLEAEGLFLLDLTAEAPAAEPHMQEPVGEPIQARAVGFQPEPWIAEGPVEPVAEAAWEAEEEVLPAAPTFEEEPPVFELTERTPWAEEPAPLVAEAPLAPAAEPIATATLGQLYLRQGHFGEAERIFREVLRREPENASAQEGLAGAAGRQRESRPLAAHDLLAGFERVAGGEAATRARKVWVLNSYLKRLRRGSQRDVS